MASSTGSQFAGGFGYVPATAHAGASDLTPENIKAAELVFPASFAVAASTATGGSLQVQLVQYNSAGATQNSAALYNQSANSQAAHVPIDVSTLVSAWTLSLGDHLELNYIANTAAMPAVSGCIFSCSIDATTAY